MAKILQEQEINLLFLEMCCWKVLDKINIIENNNNNEINWLSKRSDLDKEKKHI